MPAASQKTKFEFWVDADWQDDAIATAKTVHLDKSKFARRALDVAIARIKAGLPIEGDRAVVNDDPYLDTFQAPILTKAPCGPWEEALAGAGSFTISADTADELEARDGDVFVRTTGESMEAAGIQDGMLLLMRPVGPHSHPRRGEITLVQIIDSEGEYLGTIKHWAPGTPPKLTDGEGNDFAIPDDVQQIIPIATARGIIGRV